MVSDDAFIKEARKNRKELIERCERIGETIERSFKMLADAIIGETAVFYMDCLSERARQQGCPVEQLSESDKEACMQITLALIDRTRNAQKKAGDQIARY